MRYTFDGVTKGYELKRVKRKIAKKRKAKIKEERKITKEHISM